ncbi:DUF2628 domain-containing protein [Shewanella sp.]|uniref:DUF2628 domain-containing protein n=1 Tax=Shewanella sp. TaxID=50422 RepID=UPI003A878A23
MNSYNVIFKGEIAEGKDRHKLSVVLAKFLKIPEEKAHLLFSGNPICIKKALSESEANALKAKLNTVGIITYVKASPPQASATTPVASKPVTPQKVATPITTPPVTPTKTKPVIAVKPAVTSYDELSKGWQKVFAEFDLREADKLGLLACAKHPAHRSRLKSQQLKANFVVNFNILAFLFGPFYYFAKGMWKKGLYLTLMLVMANIGIYMIWELFSGSRLLDRLLPSLNCAIFAVLANYDYYRYYKLGETTWPWMPKWMSSPITIITTVTIVTAGLVLLYLFEMGSNIHRIKSTALPYYNEYNTGDALDTYDGCDKILWEEFENDRGLKFVQYTCMVDRPTAVSNYNAEIKMLNDFYDNELLQPNAIPSYIENQRKQELSLWANHVMKPKRYNIIAQFSIIDSKVKVIFTGVEIIYPDEKRNITKSYNEKEFFLNIRNNTLMAGPVYDIKIPELNVDRFRKTIEDIHRNRAEMREDFSD